MKVYVAGPISGLTYAEATKYFDWITKQLEKKGLDVFTPMVKNEYDKTFAKDEIITPLGSETNPLATNKAIFTRDVWMVRQSDIILVNFTTGKDRVSIGSCMELMAAFILGKHTIVVMKEDDIHQHAFIKEASNLVVPTIEQAIDYVYNYVKVK